MTPKEAREIIERHKHLEPAINDPQLQEPMESVVRNYKFSQGFLEGIAYNQKIMDKMAVVVNGTRHCASIPKCLCGINELLSEYQKAVGDMK